MPESEGDYRYCIVCGCPFIGTYDDECPHCHRVRLSVRVKEQNWVWRKFKWDRKRSK